MRSRAEKKDQHVAVSRSRTCNHVCFVLEVGFEPTHPKITELESAALDHSAIQASHIIHSLLTGLEPATVGFEVQRAIHCATRAHSACGVSIIITECSLVMTKRHAYPADNDLWQL